MTTGSNLLFPSKDIDSAMREKFPVILMEYVELENEKNIPQRKALIGIKVKSGRLQKITNMCVEYSKLSFFINSD